MKRLKINIETKKDFLGYCEEIGAMVYTESDVERAYDHWKDGRWNYEEYDNFRDAEFAEIEINTGEIFIIESWLNVELLEELLSEEEDN